MNIPAYRVLNQRGCISHTAHDCCNAIIMYSISPNGGYINQTSEVPTWQGLSATDYSTPVGVGTCTINIQSKSGGGGHKHGIVYLDRGQTADTLLKLSRGSSPLGECLPPVTS